jgi:hypothetical protein
MTQLDPSRYKQISLGRPYYGKSYGLYWDGTNSQLALVMNDVIVARVDATGIAADLEVSGEARGDILRRDASSWGRLAAKTTGHVLVGNDTDLISAPLTGDVTAAISGTNLVTAIGANTVLSAMMAANLVQIATGTITSADIVATGTGKFGHANGYPLVTAVGSHNVPEFVSAVLIYDYAGAAYGAGGNVTVNLSDGGAAQSDLVAAANFCGAASDKVVLVRPPTAIAAVPLVENAGLNLVAASAFTLGSATGVIRYAVVYRVHATGL